MIDDLHREQQEPSCVYFHDLVLRISRWRSQVLDLPSFFLLRIFEVG